MKPSGVITTELPPPSRRRPPRTRDAQAPDGRREPLGDVDHGAGVRVERFCVVDVCVAYRAGLLGPEDGVDVDQRHVRPS